MTMPRLIPALAATFAACLPAFAQDVPGAYRAIEWKLVAINGQPFTASATIDLNTAGQISGQGPCNRFSGSYEGPLPQFRAGPLRATRMACPDLAAESALFAALAEMTRAEVTGPTTLLLTGEKGGSMEFVRPMN
ncbi:META domain-containing protein [Pseudotabrizicola algicola]|uniref:META domain-containing protein n=1 Tax=Pseudotabrizicola algicola TaxID=2709381 RepID=A0A6B3RRV7_9RHOB|nr:META domain-containing protein [Pseudotabrizicola algicola]NEX45792.1 META domain-containing protein [Pseudotabrizicola algicola]